MHAGERASQVGSIHHCKDSVGGSHDARSVKALAEMEVGLTMAAVMGINQQRRDIFV